MTSEIYWGIEHQTVCQKSVWLGKFEIEPEFDSFSPVTAVRLSHFFDLIYLIGDNRSKCAKYEQFRLGPLNFS